METYNGERFLRKQLHSLSAQAVLPYELVVCGDGSDDRTLDILNDFAASSAFPVHIYRNSERLGYGDNFRKAVSLCLGELIAFRDQDDVRLPEKLETCAQFFICPEIILVTHNTTIVDSNMVPFWIHLWGIPKTILDNRALWAKWFCPSGFAMVFRQWRCHNRPPCFVHQERAMDHDPWIFFLAHALGKVSFLPARLSLYRQHGDNTCGASKFDSRDIVHSSNNTGYFDYVHRSDLLITYAASLERTAADAENQIGQRMLKAVHEYRYLADLYQESAKLCSPTETGIGRPTTLINLSLKSVYRSRKKGGLGAKAVMKDCLAGLVWWPREVQG